MYISDRDDTYSCASCTHALRTWKEVTYLRPYVNNMLKNHPHGDKFKEVRRLA